MTKVSFGEYGAFTNKNSVRFQKNNRLVSEQDVPKEVADHLRKLLNRPTEAQSQQLKEESLRVPENLQAAERPVEPTLTADDDFDALDVSGEPLPKPVEPVSPIPEQVAHEPIEGERLPDSVDSDFLETISIHTASLKDMAEAIYNRFGIYTVYLGELPKNDEINPLTGEVFTKYHLGIAYQAAIKAQVRGLPSPEEGRRAMDEGRSAHQNFQVDPVPQTLGEARQANSFDYRTSVRGANESINGTNTHFDEREDEPIVEPSFGKKVIRPNW